MAQISPTNPPKEKVDWKRKLNLDRTNARRASSLDASEGNIQTVAPPKINPRFRELMSNLGVPRTETLKSPSNQLEPTNTSASPIENEEDDLQIGATPSADGQDKLRPAADILAEDQSANNTGSGISTGLEDRASLPSADTPAKEDATKAQMNQPSMSMPPTPPTPNAGESSTGTGKAPSDKEKAKQEKQLERDVVRGSSEKRMEALKKLAGPQGKTAMAAEALKGGKEAGPNKTLKRLAHPPGSITGKIGTLMRLILMFTGGSLAVDTIDDLLGEDIADKFLTFNLLQSCFMNCCLPMMPFLILAASIIGVISLLS